LTILGFRNSATPTATSYSRNGFKHIGVQLGEPNIWRRTRSHPVAIMSLGMELRGLWGRDRDRRVAVIGMGSEFGDEAAGLMVADHLKGLNLQGTLVIRAEDRPENFTEHIRRFNPTHILFVQAASFGGRPGETRLLPLEKHSAGSLHESPLTTLVHYLDTILSAQVRLLVIEPKGKLGDPSPAIVKAAKQVAEEIAFTLI